MFSFLPPTPHPHKAEMWRYVEKTAQFILLVMQVLLMVFQYTSNQLNVWALNDVTVILHIEKQQKTEAFFHKFLPLLFTHPLKISKKNI